MKVEWIFTNVTVVGSPEKAEHDNLGMILDVFRPIEATDVVGEPLCDTLGISLET